MPIIWRKFYSKHFHNARIRRGCLCFTSYVHSKFGLELKICQNFYKGLHNRIISGFMIHHIFSLARDWCTRQVTWLNMAQQISVRTFASKYGDYCLCKEATCHEIWSVISQLSCKCCIISIGLFQFPQLESRSVSKGGASHFFHLSPNCTA